MVQSTQRYDLVFDSWSSSSCTETAIFLLFHVSTHHIPHERPAVSTAWNLKTVVGCLSLPLSLSLCCGFPRPVVADGHLLKGITLLNQEACKAFEVEANCAEVTGHLPRLRGP